jgi:hypothetical protein
VHQARHLIGCDPLALTARERLDKLIDGAESEIGARNVHLLRWHLGDVD